MNCRKLRHVTRYRSWDSVDRIRHAWDVVQLSSSTAATILLGFGAIYKIVTPEISIAPWVGSPRRAHEETETSLYDWNEMSCIDGMHDGRKTNCHNYNDEDSLGVTLLHFLPFFSLVVQWLPASPNEPGALEACSNVTSCSGG